MLHSEKISLSEDGRVYAVPYIQDESPEIPLSHKRPFMVVVPGGGYHMTSDREAEPIALAFMAQGFSCAVLRYSVGSFAKWPNPQVDLMRCMKMVRDHAKEWCVDPDAITVCGFSAGGHLVASLGVYWNDPELLAKAGVTAEEAKPNALILNYPVISGVANCEQGTIRNLGKEEAEDPAYREKVSLEKHVGPHTPPTYLAHTFFDEVVPVENSLLFASALAKNNIPFELHVTQDGHHGLATGTHVTAAGLEMTGQEYAAWIPSSARWLRKLFGYMGPADPDFGSALGRVRKTR